MLAANLELKSTKQDSFNLKTHTVWFEFIIEFSDLDAVAAENNIVATANVGKFHNQWIHIYWSKTQVDL